MQEIIFIWAFERKKHLINIFTRVYTWVAAVQNSEACEPCIFVPSRWQMPPARWKALKVTITHFSLLALLSSFLQPCSYSWRSKCLGSIIWQADVYASRPKCFPWISTNRIQWRKYAFLDGLWGTETGVQQKCHWRKSKANLWRLHFYPFSKRGTLLSLIHSLMLFCTVNSNVFKATKIPRDNSSFPVLPHFTANKERSRAKRQTLRWQSVLLSVLLSFWLEENASYAPLTCWCEGFSLRHN